MRLKVSKMTIFKYYLLCHFSNFAKKNRQNFFHPILMKLGVVLEIDETFTTI